MNPNLKQHLNDLTHMATSDFSHYAQSVQYKLFTWIGGGSVAYQASHEAESYLPDFIMPAVEWLWSVDWLNTFTTYAVLALCVERTFVAWAWYKRFKRGDYNEGKPNGRGKK